MTIKNYYLYLRPLFKKIKKREYQDLNQDNIKNYYNILLFNQAVEEENKEDPYFNGAYNFLLLAMSKFCIKNNLNNTLECLINTFEVDVYINRNFNYLLMLSMIYKNSYFIKKNIEKIEYSHIKNNIEFINIEIIKIISNEILKNNKNEILHNIASLKNLNKENEEVFIFLIENYGYNKYYKNNDILCLLCENGYLNLIKYLHRNKLIDIDIDFNNFTYEIIKNNREDIFIFFLENYNINIHYQYDSLFYRIFIFDRVNFFKILEQYNILQNKHKKNLTNQFKEMIFLGAWNCFHYLLKNNYIERNYIFNNLVYIFKNIEESFKVKTIDINIDIKKYVEKKIKFLNYILNNISEEYINHILFESYSLFYKSHIKKELHLIEDIKLNLESDHDKIEKILSFNLEKEFIKFILNNKNMINEENYYKQINWLFLHSMYSNNIFIINILLENKQEINKKYLKVEEDIYCIFYDYLKSSFHYIELEELKFFVDFFDIDLSYNNNLLFYCLLSSSDAFVNKDYKNIINYFLTNKKVQEKLSEDIICDCRHEKDYILENIRQIKKIKNF